MRNVLDLPAEYTARVPEAQERIDREMAVWEAEADASPGSDYFFGSIIAPWMIELVKKERRTEQEEAAIVKTFDFLEELLADENANVGDVVGVSFGEQFAEDTVAVRKARSYTGPRLRSVFSLLQWR